MNRGDVLTILLHALIFLLGSGIGSFLNVVIYRLPLGLSVNNPRRSFCPICKKQIPWYRNLPLITWLAQRGKCAECSAPIPVRYFLVELITGVVFYAIFLTFGGDILRLTVWGPVVLCYWVFAALLIAGTFIDFDHYILPHEITIGGLVCGLLGSFWTPSLMDQREHIWGLWFSFISACLGLGLLWSVVELGKLAFGRLKHRYEKPEAWSITQPDENEPPIFEAAGDKLTWLDIFTRSSDRLVITCESATINQQTFGKCTVEVRMESVRVQPADGAPVIFKIEEVKKIEGMTTEIVIPREAMGFGDVLLIAMIGSFLGWKAVLFTVLAASAIGSLFAIIPRLIGKTEWTAKIPFGPYLAGGAMIYLFWGAQLTKWYIDRISWGPE
jgi:leader peptidase (prepilin peptidase)/N-methyltransferase